MIPNEFLHEPHITAQDLGGEPILGLMLEHEPDLWIQAVPASVKRSLKEKQVKARSPRRPIAIVIDIFHTIVIVVDEPKQDLLS